MDFINKGLKQVVMLMALVFSVSFAFASVNVLDVSFTENVNEYVTYNPQVAGTGLYFDANENQSYYNLTGEIFIENTHPTEAVERVVLNISNIADIYNVVNSAGKTAYLTEFNTASDYMILTIPDLAAGDNTTFTYNINTSNVAPALNLTTSYSDTKVFAGLPITVTDDLSNNLNASNYPDNCIYDINITQNAMDYNQSGTILNFSFNAASMAGTDSGNAAFSGANRVIDWNVRAASCLNSTQSTDINYEVLTPAGISTANDYQMINSTITYKMNNTISRANLVSIAAISADLDLDFQKYLNTTLTGDNATWRITPEVTSASNILVNLTTVTLWVSTRNGTGTGFTNPSIIDNDTISGAQLLNVLTPNYLINSTLSPWNNSGNGWFFNYTFSSSPIVWMDLTSNIVDDGIQLSNRSITYGNNTIYIKEIYLVTGYWLQISRNITRLADDNYSIFITVTNLGTSPTPSGQIVQVYNFIPNTFALTSPFVYGASTWHSTTNASEVLNDPIYNGTMYQYAINPLNVDGVSLAAFEGGTENDTWTLEYNISGSGEFDFEDLFLTGVDPLHVEEYGSTKALSIDGAYSVLSNSLEVVLGFTALVVAALALLL